MKTLIEEKAAELKQLLALQDIEKTKKEFLDGFKQVIDYVKQAEQNLGGKVDEKLQTASAKLDSLNQLYEDTIKKIESQSTSSLANIKKWALEEVGKIFIKSKIDAKLGELDQKLAQLDKIKFPDATTIALEASKMAQDGLLPLIPIIDKVEEQLPLLGVPMRDGLEALDGDERLAISAIKDLQEKLDELKKQVGQSLTRVIGNSSGGGRIVKSYDLSSSLNGVLTTFSLPSFWRVIDVKVSSVPVLRETTDWTQDGTLKTISFTSELNADTDLASGQSCIVIYAE